LHINSGARSAAPDRAHAVVDAARAEASQCELEATPFTEQRRLPTGMGPMQRTIARPLEVGLRGLRPVPRHRRGAEKAGFSQVDVRPLILPRMFAPIRHQIIAVCVDREVFEQAAGCAPNFGWPPRFLEVKVVAQMPFRATPSGLG
jgi:hypothetical protein